jgi:superfamily II DNA or RNA helicase
LKPIRKKTISRNFRNDSMAERRGNRIDAGRPWVENFGRGAASRPSPRFVHNSGYQNILQDLVSNLQTCDSFEMSVAFVRYSGLQLLLDTLRDLDLRQIPGRILTSTYLNSTEPKALERLRQFSNIKTKVFVPSVDRGFHTKGYIFRQQDQCRVIIGSANLTQSALKSNVEWNVLNQDANTAPFVSDILHEFEKQWQDSRSKELSDEFLEEYTAYVSRLGKQTAPENAFAFENVRVIPNQMQENAISKLHRLRANNERRALAIAATGSGKTYMAVFDSLQCKPKRLLFIVHREDILRKAKQSFEAIIDTSLISTGYFTGNTKDSQANFLFATIQTLQRHYELFKPDEFEYIVVDEAHHASSPSYQNVLQWFQPKFMLGLTATPERSDGGDIYSIFNNNVAVEIRLRQALGWDLVAPFHYFGITEFSEINYSNVDIEDTAAVARLLMVSRRVDYIIEKMQFYGHDGGKRKALGFCANIEHARFMTMEFNRRGIPAVALTGADDIDARSTAMSNLEADGDNLEIIFTVDIFNEGIDIPSVNTILMLRPTESAIIFVQQLGRGLRKTPEKEFVTVLDFIGNHRKSFLMAIALMGNRHFDRDDLKVAVATDFADIPGNTYIQMDRIAKEQILAQLEQEKFFSLKYLRQEYQDFRRITGGIPKLVDFLKVDSAVDPLKFSDHSGTWLRFVATIEGTAELSALSVDIDLANVLRFFTDLLPLRRIYEAVIARFTLKNGRITPEQALKELAKHLATPHRDTIDYAFDFLSGDYLDTAESTKFKDLLFEKEGSDLVPSDKLKGLAGNATQNLWIQDLLQYGILRYELEFGANDYGVPHLKLWEQYTMRNLALLSNAKRIHSSFRGQGLITYENDFFIFVDLHKDQDIKASINYKDQFINPSMFQWESPNTTSPHTGQGERLISHKAQDISMHLFARKFRQVEGAAQPFTYFGKLDYVSHDPKKSKPMQINYALHNEVPPELYFELTTKV